MKIRRSSKVSYFFLLPFFFFLLLLLSTGGSGQARVRSPARPRELSAEFYEKACPQVENLVGSVASLRHKSHPSSGPATIRLFFLDCFLQGCDGSILLEEGSEGKGVAVEREMFENKNLAPEGFDTVNLAKAAVEKMCPGLVSCADILAIAARDFVHLAGGPYYVVKKGRKDSKSQPSPASLWSKVRAGVPRPNSTVTELIALFAAKGLTTTDLVALSGAHTIGFSHCDHFVYRLYTGSTPTMDPRLLQALRMQCPRSGGNGDVVAPLDVVTPFNFDNEYYVGIGKGMGVLATDQALGLDERTAAMVREMAGDKGRFLAAFEAGMERLGGIGVKKGMKGEIRRYCGSHLTNR